MANKSQTRGEKEPRRQRPPQSQSQQPGNQKAMDKSFDIVKDGNTYTFDSFECAIQALAPTCAACSCRIIGYGLESAGKFYCCDHCAEKEGVTGLKDRK